VIEDEDRRLIEEAVQWARSTAVAVYTLVLFVVVCSYVLMNAIDVHGRRMLYVACLMQTSEAIWKHCDRLNPDPPYLRPEGLVDIPTSQGDP
jgi:hypothetical protein